MYGRNTNLKIWSDPDYNENDDTQIIIQNLNELQNIPPENYHQSTYNSISNANDQHYHTTAKNFSVIQNTTSYERQPKG